MNRIGRGTMTMYGKIGKRQLKNVAVTEYSRACVCVCVYEC